MIISFGGNIGSGKSTIAKMLAEKLGWPRYYIGGILRQQAKERGLSIEEFYKLGETDPSIDKGVDDYQRELGKKENNFIIEGRTSWFLIPHSYKIFLAVDEIAGAQRVWRDLVKSDQRNEGHGVKTLEDVIKINQQRKQSEIERYQKYYQKDIFNLDNYDLVLNTTDLALDEVFEQVYTAVRSKLANIDKS